MQQKSPKEINKNIFNRYKMETEKLRKKQGNKCRNAQLRYTNIVHCTLWEECKQTKCPHRSWRERIKALMWFYSPTKTSYYINLEQILMIFWLSGKYGKYNRNIFLFHPLGPFPSKMMLCPWILCFNLLTLQYTDLTHQIWRFLVFIFLGKKKIFNFWFRIIETKFNIQE